MLVLIIFFSPILFKVIFVTTHSVGLQVS